MGKRQIAVIVIILLILSTSLHAVRSGYFFKSLKGKTTFNEFEKELVKNSPDYNAFMSAGKEKYLVLYDSDESASIDTKNNAVKVLSYMKKELTEKNTLTYFGDFTEFYCVVITFEVLDKLRAADKLLAYAESGGRVVIARVPLNDDVTFNRIYRRFGIFEKGDYSKCSDIRINTDILIKGSGLVFRKLFETSRIKLHLEDDCIVHCEALDGIPLIWEKKSGKGKIIFVNGEFLSEKSTRGILAGIFGIMQDTSIYPVVNSALLFIDDFPAPIPDGDNDMIYKEYKKDINNFYRDIWWPDMLRLSKKYGFLYSAFVIESYNDTTNQKQFAKKSLEDKNSITVYGRELLKSGGELGIHGHNHQPLVLKGYLRDDIEYKPWNSIDDMAVSIKEAENFIKSVFFNYKIKSYVPPSNILSWEGRESLRIALADLKVISSLYITGSDLDTYEQEFEVADDGIIEFPRLSFGYQMTDLNKWMIYNGITMHGIFSHFIHPDDILDVNRSSSLSWSKLFQSFESILQDVSGNFGWLRKNTISDGAVELTRYLGTKVAFNNDEGMIRGSCENFKKELFFVLRTKKALGKLINCEYEKIDENIYIVKATDCDFSIELKVDR